MFVLFFSSPTPSTRSNSAFVGLIIASTFIVPILLISLSVNESWKNWKHHQFSAGQVCHILNVKYDIVWCSCLRIPVFFVLFWDVFWLSPLYLLPNSPNETTDGIMGHQGISELLDSLEEPPGGVGWTKTFCWVWLEVSQLWQILHPAGAAGILELREVGREVRVLLSNTSRCADIQGGSSSDHQRWSCWGFQDLRLRLSWSNHLESPPHSGDSAHILICHPVVELDYLCNLCSVRLAHHAPIEILIHTKWETTGVKSQSVKKICQGK